MSWICALLAQVAFSVAPSESVSWVRLPSIPVVSTERLLPLDVTELVHATLEIVQPMFVKLMPVAEPVTTPAETDSVPQSSVAVKLNEIPAAELNDVPVAGEM